MSIGCACPGCGKEFYLEERLAGRVVGCPACRQQFRIPEIPAPAPVQPAIEVNPAVPVSDTFPAAQAPQAIPVSQPVLPATPVRTPAFTQPGPPVQAAFAPAQAPFAPAHEIYSVSDFDFPDPSQGFAGGEDGKPRMDSGPDEPIYTRCRCGQSIAASPESSGEEISCPRCGRPVFVRALHLVWPLKQKASASCPCGIPFERGRYLSIMGFKGQYTSVVRPMMKVALLQFVLLTAGAFVALIVPWKPAAIIVLAVPILLCALQGLFIYVFFAQPPKQFACGNLCPGVIVSLSPPLAAVQSDLSKGGPSYPVIRVLELPFEKCREFPLRLGARLPLAAVYEQTPNDSSPRWANFRPEPVAFATSDELVVEQCMMLIDETEWQELESLVVRLPRPRKPGLFLINVETLIDVTRWSQYGTAEQDPYL